MAVAYLADSDAKELIDVKLTLMRGGVAVREETLSRLQDLFQARKSSWAFISEISKQEIVPLLLELSDASSTDEDDSLVSVWDVVELLMTSDALMPEMSKPKAVRVMCSLLESVHSVMVARGLLCLCKTMKWNLNLFDEAVVRKFETGFRRLVVQIGDRPLEMASCIRTIVEESLTQGPRLYRCTVPVVVMLLNSEEDAVLHICLDILLTITLASKDIRPDVKLAVARANMSTVLVNLQGHEALEIAKPALLFLGCLWTNDDVFAAYLMRCGLAARFRRFLSVPCGVLRAEACMLISCIARIGSRDFIQKLIELEFVPKIIEILHNDEPKVKGLASAVLREIAQKGNLNQVQYLVDAGAVPALCALLLHSLLAQPVSETLFMMTISLRHNKAFFHKFRSALIPCGAPLKLHKQTSSRFQSLREVSRALLDKLEFDH